MSKFQEIINGRVVSLSNGHMAQMLVGLESGKISDPSKGDTYFATDSMKLYSCFINGSWSPVVSYAAEEAVNHDGTATNYWVVGVSGTGTASTDGATNTMTIGGGVTNAGTSYYKSNQIYGLSGVVAPLIGNFKLGTITDGTASKSDTFVGLKFNFALADNILMAAFHQKQDGSWETKTATLGGGHTETSITALASGDIVTVVANTVIALFIVNGSLVASHTTNLPDSAVSIGAGVVSINGVLSERSIGIRMIGMKMML